MRSVEFLKIGDILSKSHKIVIKEGQGWAANIKNREVFYRKADIYNLAEDHILGLLLHEIAHIHYTTEVKLPKKDEELMHSILNMLEDIAVEHIISGDYPNAGEILKSTETEMLDTLVRMLPKMNNISIHEKAILYGAVRFRGRGYAFGFEEYEKIGDEIAKIMQNHEKEILERSATKELIPIAQEINDLLLKRAGIPDKNDKDRMMNDAKQHTNASAQTNNAEPTQKTIKALGGRGWKESNLSEPTVKYVDEITDQAEIIGKQLRTILKRNNAMEFAGRFRTGKLLTKSIRRIVVNKDRNPFARRIIKSNQSYAFAIASDVSGSMFGNHSSIASKPDWGDYALSSMQMVGEALRKARIPRALVIFGAIAKTAVPMTRNAIRWEQIAAPEQIKKARPGGTDIGLAIEACTAELKKIRVERKIMIILTDGSSDLHSIKEAYKKAKTEAIECIGITIGDGYNLLDQVFKEKQNFLIKDTKNTALIGKAFIDVLKRAVTKSP